ncbi:MAG: AI-2E family transporter [Deltaproteobacteria bacterium]|nr:MAG: AI-2E family transporter [Deltaproteobacteria bacterium]
MERDNFYRNLFVVMIVVLGLGVLYAARSLLSPVVLALVVAYVLFPLVERASEVGISKGLTIFAIFVVTSAATLYSVYRAVPTIRQEIVAFSDPGQKLNSNLVQTYIKLHKQLQGYGLVKKKANAKQFVRRVKAYLSSQSQWFFRNLRGAAQQMFQFFLIFFFVLIFALKDGDKMHKTIVGFIPNSVFEPGLYMLNKTTELFGSYLRGLVIENIILGVFAFVLLFVLSLFTPLTVGMSLLIAIIIALTNVIRIVGPAIGGIVGMGLVLFSSAHFPTILGVMVIAMIVQLLDNAVVLPLVMQGQMDLHPVVSLLSVLTGGIIAGILGMMLAIPIAGGVKAIYHIAAVEMKKFDMEPEPYGS